LNFENIQIAVVKRKSNGSKINISQINEENRNDDYECIVCGSDVIPVAPNGKILSGNEAKVTPHFKHLNAEKCGSESFLHFWMKTEFIKIGDKFKVITDKENEYICNQIFFEKTIIINGKKYTPDATVITSCGNTIHFEYNYSNSKKIKDYLDRWKELNHIIIEVDLNSITCVFSDSIPTFKALYYEGKCFNLNEEDNFYYNAIGKYKLTSKDRKVLDDREIEIEKLDYLWDDIRKIKYENKGYDDIGKLIRSISSEESRKIAIDILSKHSCGGSILHNYVAFLKDKIDKRLKLLNLKHNGYLIKYETVIPRLIYDRIFKGIIIKFYTLGSDASEEYQTYNYKFSKDILSKDLKSKIDKEITILSKNHNMLTHILDILQLNNKIIDHKLHYKENTDYIDAIYLKDYRQKDFIIYWNDFRFIEKTNDEFIEIFQTTDNVKFIDTYELKYKNDLNIFITETKDSYIFKEISVVYRCNIFKQKKMLLTYKFLSDFKFLPRYNFVRATPELRVIEYEIEKYKYGFILKEEYYTKVYKDGEIIEISDIAINKRIEQLLYPIVYASNNCNLDSLNLILNIKFTKDSIGKFRPWLVKEFIETIKSFTDIKIQNIKQEEEYIDA